MAGNDQCQLSRGTKKQSARRLPFLLFTLTLMLVMLLVPQSANAASLSKKAKPKFLVSGCRYTQGKVTLTWKEVKGAKKYIIYRASKKNGRYKKFASTKKLTITKKSSAKYYYKVQAAKGSRKSKKSAALHPFAGHGNIYQSLRTNVSFFYSRTIYYAAFKNETKKTMTIKENATCTFYQLNPSTGKMKKLQTGTVVSGATIKAGKDASVSVRADAPTVESGTVLVIKIPFKSGGKYHNLYIARDPSNTWVK